MKLSTAAQMKEMDRIAIEERGIPSDVLMERAAAALAGEVQDLAEERRPRPAPAPPARRREEVNQP